MPTFFLRCVKSLRIHGIVDVILRKDIDADRKIFSFKNHWRYQDYTRQYQVTPEEWQTIFALRQSVRQSPFSNHAGCFLHTEVVVRLAEELFEVADR